MFDCLAADVNRASRRYFRGLWGFVLCVPLACVSVASPGQQGRASFHSGGLSESTLGLAEGGSTPDLRLPGSISGLVRDRGGATVAGAVVTLATEDPAQTQSRESSSDGGFVFDRVESGPYKLSVATAGLGLWSAAGTLERGQKLSLPEIALSVSSANIEIEVLASNSEVAAAQLGLAEKQRVLGVFPNFYASYLPNAVALTPRQKFGLAWRLSIDPVTFGMAGAIAGVEQSQNGFKGYGQGAQGYGKRLGANYADAFSSTMIGQGVLPSLFHQDPRYFVKGTGSVRSRALYAIAMTVMCKGDKGGWQVNYSNLLGNVASAGISNLYYPSSSGRGVGVTMQNSLLTTSSGALGSLIQEFLLHRMTPNIPDYGSAMHR